MTRSPTHIPPDVFRDMTPEAQRASFGENGFTVVPGAIKPDHLAEILSDIDRLGWGEKEANFWSSPAVARLVENEAVVAAVRNIYGPDIRFFKGVYVARPPAQRSSGELGRQGLHIDYSTAENAQDFRNFSASWVNIGFYFTDLTPDHGPLWVVPGSNHRYELGPGRSLEHLADDARMVLVRGGDAVLFHCFTVHAGGYNYSQASRRALFLSYRPVWAERPEHTAVWPETVITAASPERQRLLVG
jgi:ectoine hydroxylase-related dioxygenase (phytanoyl-CoA dioxygenase family)